MFILLFTPVWCAKKNTLSLAHNKDRHDENKKGHARKTDWGMSERTKQNMEFFFCLEEAKKNLPNKLTKMNRESISD